MGAWTHFKASLFRGSTKKKYFPQSAIDKLEQAVAESEGGHRGELKVVIETALPLDMAKLNDRFTLRARQLFSLYQIWDTEDNSGVLIYLNLAERAIEIVADRGIHQKAGAQKWADCMNKAVEEIKHNNQPVDGILFLLKEIKSVLTECFPAGAGDENEISDKPVFL